MQHNEWALEVAQAEAAAQQKQAAEDKAYELFTRARSAREQAGEAGAVTDTPEFHVWMQARRDSDIAWGQWAMAMDRKPPVT